MRRLLALGGLVLATGCGTRLVLTIPRFPFARDAAVGVRPEARCRYLNVLVDYSTQAAGMEARDVRLGARVADVMKLEFERLGIHVTNEPGEAYWSLMLMAVHNQRDGGFIFSAMIHLRGLSESHDPGIATYAAGDDGSAPPTMYTAVSYGSQQDVDKLAREYVQKADAALLPAARALCASEAQEARRHGDLDQAVPHPELPL